jgi:hypothetical protein
MARYFFHTEDGVSYPDEYGTELPDLDAARAVAIRTLGEILRDAPKIFEAEMSLRLVVTDDSQLALFRLDVIASEAPSLSGRRP